MHLNALEKKLPCIDGCPSSSFLTLPICLQCSGNDFGGGDVSRDVLYEPVGRVDLISVVF